MSSNVTIREEHLTADEYIDFLKRTDLGSQYPKDVSGSESRNL